MTEADAVNHSRDVANRAMEQMAQHGIPATPENFAVWFSYIDGDIDHLKRTIEILICNGVEFDDARCDELFERFVLPGYRDRAVVDVAGGLGDLAGGLSRTLDEAGKGAGQLGAALDSAYDALKETKAANGIGTLVETLRQETEAARERNVASQAELASTTDEIQSLREKLEESQKEALTDGLTGLSNRKRFDKELRDSAKSAMEHGHSLCLLMLDIDHFKRFNDSHGHLVGDQVLRLLGRTLNESVRDTDICARYGGEEFSVILTNTELSVAAEVAERIRKRLSQKKITHRTTGEDLGSVTISIGVGQFEYGEALTALVDRTDETLYRAKQEGRNRVCIQNGG